MKKSEIDEYRRSIESDYSSTNKEIETSTSYISTLMIGFFITANDKLISLSDSEYKAFYIFGLIFLTLSFFAILARKYFAQKNNLSVLDHISEMRDEDNIEKESLLYNIWKKGHDISRYILLTSFCLLTLGLSFSIIFIIINL